MTNKLKYLIGISLKRKIKPKWFVIVNIGLLILIAGLINIDSIIKTFGGDFNEKQIVYVIDNSNITYDVLKNQNEEYSSIFQKSDDTSNYEIKKTTKEPKVLLKEKKDSWVLIINTNEKNVIDAMKIKIRKK